MTIALTLCFMSPSCSSHFSMFNVTPASWSLLRTVCIPLLTPMGRRLRTPLPQHPSLLTPELPDSTVVATRERERRAKDTASFNKRHRVRDLSQLTPGQPVWITNTKSQGTVVSPHSAPRSYIVDCPTGTIRRNRHHLVPFPETVPHTPRTLTPSTPPQPGEATLGSPERPKSPPTQTPKALTPVHTHTHGITTRCGRVVRKPHSLDL
nr:uncharacterized protein LOC133575166 [Nerophis lumbriciformis]